MAVAAKEPERDLSDMMGALKIVGERGGKHKRGCVDSQDSFNSDGRPIGADAFSRLRDRLKDRADQKHKQDHIKKETLKAAVSVQPPRRPMNRAVLSPPQRPVQLPPARFPPRPIGLTLRPAAQTENFEAEIDAGRPFLSLLQEDPEPMGHGMEDGKQPPVLMVRRIIERQMREERKGADSTDYTQYSPVGLSPKICDYGSQNASVVSSSSLDGAPEPFSPAEHSSSSSPPSVSIYTSNQSNLWPSCITEFPHGSDLNGFDDSSS